MKMSELNNARVDKAQATIELHEQSLVTIEQKLMSLIVDLRHFAEKHNIDYYRADKLAFFKYSGELLLVDYDRFDETLTNRF